MHRNFKILSVTVESSNHQNNFMHIGVNPHPPIPYFSVHSSVYFCTTSIDWMGKKEGERGIGQVREGKGEERKWYGLRKVASDGEREKIDEIRGGRGRREVKGGKNGRKGKREEKG